VIPAASHVPRRVAAFCAALCAAVCASTPSHAGQPITLTDVTRQTGIRFVHTDGTTGKRYIMETVTAGVAVFDYDGDGDPDIYFLNGAPLDGPKGGDPPRNRLYRNAGNFKFTDVTERAGVGDTGYGLGVCVGDYDNDGDLDLYVSNYGPNVLYRNNGDGTFTDVTKQAGVAVGDHVGAGANFLDADGDGLLDLFVAAYVKFEPKLHVVHTLAGHPTYSGPRDYPPSPNLLFRNNGDGTFTDVSKESGIAAHAGKGMGTVCLDYDGDGDTDIVVANDEWANFLFRNDGKGKFAEVGLASGISYDVAGEAQSSMGVCAGDYDNDGWLDLEATSYQNEVATLYRNTGDGFFEDVTRETGAGAETLPNVTWGNGFADFDNDGDRDLFIARGHINDNVEKFDDTTSYHATNVLLMNMGDGRFVSISDRAGDGLRVRLSSRGAAFEDFNGDGRTDVVILNSRREPTVLRNDTDNGHHWLIVRLRGVKSNRDGIGAQVRVFAGDLVQTEEVHSGQGYQSHFGLRPHFGLGKRDRIDRIEVRWVGGRVDVLEDVRVDQVLTITEGSGKPGARPLPIQKR